MQVQQIERLNFSTSKNKMEYPDFLDIQLKSFWDFFKLGSTHEERKNEKLHQVFNDIFPVSDIRNNFVLEFLDYDIDPPQYSIEECLDRGLTYAVSLKVKLKLYCKDPEHEDFDTKVQDVFLGMIPYITPRGNFIINGAERVIVSQLHRSPGVFFSQSFHANGTKLYSARIIPFKGSWIEFATDTNNVMYAYIDRKKKLPVTTLFRAIGYESDRDILEIFNIAEELKVNKTNIKKAIGRKLAARILKSWIEDFVDEDTGEVVSIERNEIVIERETIIDEQHLNIILESNSKSILLHKPHQSSADYAIIYNTLQKDPCNSEKEALIYIYRQLRNAEPSDEATAREIIENLFFSDKRYDLGGVGRFRINRKLGLNIDQKTRVLVKEDIIQIVKHLIMLINAKTDVDDIDHLSNRRVRTVGEQIATQFSVGFARMARTIKERMNIRDNEVFAPIDLINVRILTSVINSFFGTNPLSQFMDQTNPLAEITHKRRISSLGPGGLSRERAGFEVRDVHYTHYGRLCPIETPEGPNIGLIASLCVFAKINDLGFIETPYRNVKNSKVDLSNNKINYFSAEEEEGNIIAQANAPLSNNGNFLNDRVNSRMDSDYPLAEKEKVNLMDVAPNQITSIAASLIPFLEHDDANRALMGSNMMRQATPIIKPESPIVGTGIEERVIKDSRTQIIATGRGVVKYVDANKIIVEYKRSEKEMLTSFYKDTVVYDLPKFAKTNQNTIVSLKPLCRKGDIINKGDLLTEGFASKKGELALGRNLMVAFMPWKGYNYEDAIVVSEKIVREDIFTSIHVDELTANVRDTKLGVEEFTADIPSISEDITKNLDSNGIVRIGVHIKPGDILIGKVIPKGESDPTPEEKLLRAIFGEKAGDVKDVSLRAMPSLFGTVIDTKIFSCFNVKHDKRKKNKEVLKNIETQFSNKKKQIIEITLTKLIDFLNGKKSQSIKDNFGNVLMKKGNKFTIKKLSAFDLLTVNPNNWTTLEEDNKVVRTILHNFLLEYKKFNSLYKRKKYTATIGDELPTGVIKKAKVTIAKKRKLQIGDKMAGRHGNKGIVAKIVKQEDMPFLKDGTPVDICLNPLGVPSRMNLGQVLETVLGWVGKKLNMKFSTPVFDGATLNDIIKYTEKANLPQFGREQLYDGETGEKFDQLTTVGIIYMMKLNHMVDDKIHARSIGPYSLITQQPLGGKAQFGGQRFGEMEVWALEAFGAAHILREILTVKSDDVYGRAKTYEAIVKGESIPTPGLPESLNVLLFELAGLGLNIELE